MNKLIDRFMLFGVAGVLLLSSGCSKPEIEVKPVVRPVQTIVVGDAESVRKRSFSGATKAAVETPLSFRVSGKIVELAVNIGSKVEKGDLVARLDATDYELQVKQFQAQLKQADAQLKQAKAEYSRIRELYESKNASKSNLDAGRAAYESAKAQTEAVEKSLEMAQQQMSYCILTAPIAGAIASKAVDIHQTVAAGSPVASLTSGGKMKMQIGIPETLIAQVGVGDKAAVIFESISDSIFNADITEVGVEPTPSSTYPVELTLEKEDSRIRLGMIGEATLSFETEENVLYIPAVAVVSTTKGGRYVWVVENENTVVRCDVTIGALTTDGLQIRAGLTPGSTVVVRGVHQLKDGMSVRLLEGE